MINYVILGKPENNVIKDGGQLRTVSLYRYIENNIKEAITVPSHLSSTPSNHLFCATKGIADYIRVLAIACFGKNRINLFNYHTMPFAHPLNNFAFIKGLIFITLLKMSSVLRRGAIIINVHDLPRYQNPDLGYPLYSSENIYRIFEKVIFNFADELWPTSREMEELLRKDYRLRKKKMRIVINGNIKEGKDRSSILNKKPNEIFFVYCGTINRNRGIEHMIESFARLNSPRAKLIIIGIDEAGLMKDYASMRENVVYLGQITAAECNATAKQCDIGIICYPNKYFDITYCCKLSFYITCGLPILAVDTKVAKNLVRREKIGIACKAEELSEKMRYLAEKDDIRNYYRKNVAKIKHQFYWKEIFEKTFSEFFREKKMEGWKRA